MKTIKRFTVFVSTFILCMFVVWYAGVDMFVTSVDNAFTLVISIFISSLMSACRHLPKEYKLFGDTE